MVRTEMESVMKLNVCSQLFSRPAGSVGVANCSSVALFGPGLVKPLRSILRARARRLAVLGAALPLVTAAVFTAPSAVAAPVFGATPWTVVLCKYAGASAEPLTAADAVRRFVSPGVGGMADYWRDASYGNIDISGGFVPSLHSSRAKNGWYDLADLGAGHAISDFQKLPNGARRAKLLNDCRGAAGDDVKLEPWSHLLIVTNVNDGDTFGVAGPTIGGITIAGATSVEPGSWNVDNFVGQEMGHGYGLNHSWDTSPCEYCDEFDVMGNFRNGVGYKNVALAAPQRFGLGWISASRVFAPTPGIPTVQLAALTQPTVAGFLMARIADSGDPSHFYTVEYRQQQGWDSEIPGNGVVIHEVRSDGKIVFVPVKEASNRALTVSGETFMNAAGTVRVQLNCINPAAGTATVSFAIGSYGTCGSGATSTPPAGSGGGSGGGGSAGGCGRNGCGLHPPGWHPSPILFT